MKLFESTMQYIKKDWETNPVRLILEFVNWIGNVIIAIIIAATVPHTPFLILYPIWFLCTGISIFSAVSRGSTGLLLASVSLLLIDIVGAYRLITS